MHNLIKSIFYLIFILTPMLSFASNISSNQCIKDMEQGQRTKYGDELDLTNCDLKDQDILQVVAYLNAHPEINFALDLDQNQDLTPNGLSLLGNIHTVKAIGFDSSGLGDAGAEAFAKANISFNYVSFIDNNVGDVGTTALANNKAITWLQLNKNPITKIGARALAESASLNTLDLTDDNKMGDQGAAELAKSNLRILNLANDNITDGGAHIFIKSNISELYFGNNAIGNQGVVDLASNNNIRILCLDYNKITNISAFEKNSSIFELYISHNQITDMSAIAKNTTLKIVELDYNQINDKGLEGLEQNQILAILFLSRNQLTNPGAFILAKMNLNQLDVSYNHIGQEGVATLKEKYGALVNTEGNDGKVYTKNKKCNTKTKRRWLMRQ